MSEVRTGNQLDPTNLIPVEADVDLSSVGQMSHLVNPATNQQYLRLEDESHVPYPVPGEEDIIDYLLLPTTVVDGSRYLHLPSTYCTFTQALENIATNATQEASGSESAIAEGGVLQEAKTLFEQLGNQLDELTLGDGVIPEDMHMRQVLVTEDERELQIKFLPPLRVRSIEDPLYTQADTRMMVLQQLFNSCRGLVTNQVVRDSLPAAFKGLTETFSLGRDLQVPQTLGQSALTSVNKAQ